MIEVNIDNFFDEVICSDKPVLVEFSGNNCAVCEAIEPVIERLSVEYESSLKIVRINIDNNAQLAVRFYIRSLPTFLLFGRGKPREQFVGRFTFENLGKFLQSHIDDMWKGDCYEV